MLFLKLIISTLQQMLKHFVEQSLVQEEGPEFFSGLGISGSGPYKIKFCWLVSLLKYNRIGKKRMRGNPRGVTREILETDSDQMRVQIRFMCVLAQSSLSCDAGVSNVLINSLAFIVFYIPSSGSRRHTAPSKPGEKSS